MMRLMSGFALAMFLAALPAAAQTPVRVGVLKLSSSAPVFIAYDKGYFAAQGLAVTLKFFDAAQPVAVAAAAGDIDIGVTAFTAGLFNVAGKGAVAVVAGQSREQPGYPLIGYFATAKAYEAGLKNPPTSPARTSPSPRPDRASTIRWACSRTRTISRSPACIFCRCNRCPTLPRR